jgi:hypothetical protein
MFLDAEATLKGTNPRTTLRWICGFSLHPGEFSIWRSLSFKLGGGAPPPSSLASIFFLHNAPSPTSKAWISTTPAYLQTMGDAPPPPSCSHSMGGVRHLPPPAVPIQGGGVHHPPHLHPFKGRDLLSTSKLIRERKSRLHEEYSKLHEE